MRISCTMNLLNFFSFAIHKAIFYHGRPSNPCTFLPWEICLKKLGSDVMLYPLNILLGPNLGTQSNNMVSVWRYIMYMEIRTWEETRASQEHSGVFHFFWFLYTTVFALPGKGEHFVYSLIAERRTDLIWNIKLLEPNCNYGNKYTRIHLFLEFIKYHRIKRIGTWWHHAFGTIMLD